MKGSVFIDSSFWIALLDKRDQNHLSAKTALKPLLQNHQICLSDFIIFETITYLNCSIKRHDLAISFLQKVESPGLFICVTDEIVKLQALKLFKQYPDKYFSVVDCTSFVLMQSKKIQYFLGFDEHFKQMGFLNILSHLDTAS